MKRICTFVGLFATGISLAASPSHPGEVTITRPNASTLNFRWHSTRAEAGNVEIWQGEEPHETIAAVKNGDDYRAEATGLKGNTETRFILSPQGDAEHSRQQLTATLPPKGTLETETLPLLAVVYSPIHYSDAPAGGLPAGVSKNLTNDDLELIRKQLEDVRSFYFHATHGRLNLTWDISAENTDIGNRPSLDAGDVTGAFEASMARVLKEKGKKVGDYAGVVFMFGWGEGISPEAKAKVYRGQAHSGGTYGWDAPWNVARTPYTMINFGHRADIRWTVTHEFGHQLDSMADYSGYPSLAFNHPDPITDVGAFGEHWDCNYWLLSHFPRDNWANLVFGTRHLSKDTDSDGLADDDPTLPIDEKRFHSDPKKADTDSDGLSDLDEYSVTSGVYAGLNEEMASGVKPPDPRNPDTDGDGIPDGADPYPSYPAQTLRRFATPVLDGRWDKGEWQTMGMSANLSDASGTKVKAEFGLEWDDQYLYVSMRSSAPADLVFDIDAMNDGWFAGTDNYRMVIAAPAAGATEPVISSVIWDWSVFDPTKDPNPYLNQSKDIVKASDISAVAAQTGGAYVLEAAIPMNYKTGLRLYSGKRMGVKLGARLPGGKQVFTLFEPQRLMTVELHRDY
ncbi:MAG TPA: hypothetical protein VGM51_18680 [Armatimonadota bacterium]|jgi:hypothetical protein